MHDKFVQVLLRQNKKDGIFVTSEFNFRLKVAMLGKLRISSGSSFHSLTTDGRKEL